MSTTLLVIIGGCLLGVVQLAVGIAVGMWLRRPDGRSRDADLMRARTIALQLHGLTQRIGSQVSDHRSQFEAADAKLREIPTGKHHPTTDLVVGVVGEVLAANRQLQQELAAAETQIAEQAREIESQMTISLTDPLTNLPNRRALDEQLAGRLQDYRKHGMPFSVLMVDVDHFKQINDTFGHPVGDEVLVSLGGALRKALRKHDFVARYGGEEFAVIFPHTTLQEAQRAASKACSGIGVLTGEFEYLNRPITASAGLASIYPGEDIESLVRRADDALYMAKHKGRDRTYMHNGSDCVPLDAQLASGEPWQQNAGTGAEPAELQTIVSSEPEDSQSNELLDACDDLRSAMMGAVGSSAEVAAAPTAK